VSAVRLTVRPILSYACEVWTSCTRAKGLQQVEQVHRMFLRGILWVNKTTSIFVVLGEFGRYPLEYFGDNKLSSIMIDYGSPHHIVCCTVPTRPSSRCSVCSMITNSVGSETCSCGLTTKGLGFSILMSSVL